MSCRSPLRLPGGFWMFCKKFDGLTFLIKMLEISVFTFKCD